jgi:hypothetical protein
MQNKNFINMLSIEQRNGNWWKRPWNDWRYDVFISYNYVDRDYAKRLAQHFREAGLRVWFDAWEVQPGMAIADGITQGLEHSKCQLVLVGKEGVARGSRLEYDYVHLNNKNTSFHTIIPILLPFANKYIMPPFLSRLVPYNLSEWTDEQVAKLTEFLKHLLPSLRDPGTGNKSLPSVFLCHAIEDSNKAQDLYFGLREQMIDPWYDREDLYIGDDWEAKIMEVIEKVDFFAVLISSVSAVKTGFIQKEIRKAVSQFQLRPHGTSYLLPIRLENCPIPNVKLDENLSLRSLQWFDIFQNDKKSIRQLGVQIWAKWEREK